MKNPSFLHEYGTNHQPFYRKYTDTRKMEYLIEKRETVPVFGTSGSIHRWAFWEKFDNPAERDKEISRLRIRHPEGVYRARDYNPILNRPIARF